MAYYGTIVGKKSITENLIGKMSTHDTQYIPYPEYTGINTIYIVRPNTGATGTIYFSVHANGNWK